ncbi:MAG: bifunctional oligoribonuclease/PAP phosphatase NrnA [Anaerolineae bacterium]
MRLDWDMADNLIASANNVIIITHLNPDGDAFGSMLGLGNALMDGGKAVTMAVDEGLSERFKFLPNSAMVRADLNGIGGDLGIVVDCSDERRTGKVGEQLRALNIPIINLDHHRTNTLFGTAVLVDENWVSATEGVLAWLDHLKIKPQLAAAQCLLCGLVTDTLCFRTDSVTAETLHIAQRLMGIGANLSEIVQRAMTRVPTAVIRLWREVMPTVKIEDHVIWVKVTLAARKAAELDRGDGNLVNMLLQADDAYCAAVFKEQDDGIVDVSMRAVPGFNVANVALQLGGGGHVLAAGASMQLPIDEVETKVVPLLKQAAAIGKPIFA